MRPYRAALLALVVVGGALVTAVPAGATSGVDATHDAIGATGAQVDATEAQGDEVVERASAGAAHPAAVQNESDAQNETDNNTSLGADISAFMQSSAAEADGAVETGMWTAAFNGTENRSVRERLVERRTSELRTELAELQEQKEQLLAERAQGNISETAYKAKISRLVGQINALKSSINATSSRAKKVNTNVEALDALRTEANNLTGPEIASVARNVTGANVENGAGGPPGDVGNGNGPSDAGNGNGGPPNDAGAENATNGPGNNTTDVGQRGPPSDSANSPMVGNAPANGSAANASTPAGPARTGNGSVGSPGNLSVGSSGNASAGPPGDGPGVPAFSSVTTVTTDFVEPITGFEPLADALDV